MKVDISAFKMHSCRKCMNYSDDKLIFGKCIADKSSIYSCAKLVLSNREEFIRKTGVNDGAF